MNTISESYIDALRLAFTQFSPATRDSLEKVIQSSDYKPFHNSSHKGMLLCNSVPYNEGQDVLKSLVVIQKSPNAEDLRFNSLSASQLIEQWQKFIS